MVDMEPAQYAQTVGVRWEAKQRLTTNGMFPPYKNTKTEPVLSIKNAKTVQSVRINPLAIQIDPPEVISHDEDSYTDAPVWMTKKE